MSIKKSTEYLEDYVEYMHLKEDYGIYKNAVPKLDNVFFSNKERILELHKRYKDRSVELYDDMIDIPHKVSECETITEVYRDYSPPFPDISAVELTVVRR